jgi:hypothetical protein
MDDPAFGVSVADLLQKATCRFDGPHPGRPTDFSDKNRRQVVWSKFGVDIVRYVLVLGLLITLCASAHAATVHRSKSPILHLSLRQYLIVRPG